MQRFLCGSVIAIATVVLASQLQAEPHGVVAGWHGGDGRVLIGELNCAACHAASDLGDQLLTKTSPDLTHVGARVTPQYLRKFLASTHTVKPGTTMPDLLQGVPEGERGEAVESLVHFLVSHGGPIDQRSSGASIGEIDSGRDLFHSIGCVACHQPIDPPAKHKIDAAQAADDDEEKPDDKLIAALQPSAPLPPLAMKTTVTALAEFLHDPLAARPAGRMPAFHFGPGEPRALAAYLLREQYSESEKALGSGVDFAYFRGGFNTTADLAKAKPEYETQLPEMDMLAGLAKVPIVDGRKPTDNGFGVRFRGLLDVPADGKYKFWTHSDDGSVLMIAGKVVVDNDGQHPPTEKAGEIDLRRGRHPLEALFVQGGGGYELAITWQPPGATERTSLAAGVLLNQAAAMIPQGIEDFKVDEAKVARGRELFGKLGCASCHTTGEKFDTAVSAAPLAKLNTSAAGGCLSDSVKRGVPRFDLTKAQRDAIATTLKSFARPTELSSQAKLHLTMASLNCYACHQRGDVGGPEDARRDYFVYEKIVDLGDEGRLPPPLHEVGAKLTDDGFSDMLIAGKPYRTYMATRMPLFGEKNIGHAHELFRASDAGKIAAHKPEFTPRHIDDGRFLVGNKGLSCINCHAWGGLRLPGAEGMDLALVPRRLQPGWFVAWLKDPQKMRPGTRMPSAWPQGKSFFAEVQKGSVDGQIDAIWAYLALGEKGGMPLGLSPTDATLLTPTEEPIIFRTFLNQVSAHAILVGFRQRTHMAFDANRVRSVVAWTGDFITTKSTWEGRAGEYASIPSNDIVQLPEGPPFAVLESEAAKWPTDVPKKSFGSDRTPPGWRFRGYRIDAEGMPTFLYDIGKVRVEESPASDYTQGEAVLIRRFKLKSPEAITLQFRAATGKKIVAEDGGYVADEKLHFRVSSQPEAKPVIRALDGSEELLVPLALEGGKEVSLELRMAW